MRRFIIKPQLLIIFFITTAVTIIAQPRVVIRGHFDPSDMVAREKQNLYQELTNLSADQKLLLDGIYDEFALSMKETVEEMMRGGTPSPETMRTKMEALRKEKDELVGDVLNEEQYAIYQKQMESVFGRMREKERQVPSSGKDSTANNGTIGY